MAERLIISIDLEGASLQDDYVYEIEKILKFTAKRLGHGEGYEYAHNAADGVAAQDYLGVDREYYRPVPRGFEKDLAQRLETIRAKLREGRAGE